MDPATAPAVRNGEPGANFRAQRIVLGALLLEFLVLVVSGVALFFIYRPTAAQPWSGVDAPTETVVTAFRTVHRAASHLAVLTAVGAVVVFVTTVAHGRKLAGATGGTLVAAVVAASFTGYLLPWDQLALWAVTVGENMSGYRPMFSDSVRFVLIGGTEIGSDTIIRWLGVHIVVLTPMALLLVLALWRQRGRQQSIDIAREVAGPE